MGQSASSASGLISEEYTHKELIRLFRCRATKLLTKTQFATLSSKVNSRDAAASDSILTYGDLTHLLQLSPSADNDSDPAAIDTESGDHDHHKILSSVDDAIVVLYRTFVVLGRLPFLTSGSESQLSTQSLIVALAVHSGQLSRIWPDYDYVKLFFASMALAGSVREVSGDAEKGNLSETRSSTAESSSPDPEKQKSPKKFKVNAIAAPPGTEDDLNVNSRRIKWDSLSSLTSYDNVDFDSMKVSAHDLVLVIALLLLINSVPIQPLKKMQQEVASLVAHKWGSFVASALTLVRSFKVVSDDLKETQLSYAEFREGVDRTLYGFFQNNFRKLLEYSLFSVASSVDETGESEHPEHPEVPKKTHVFESSRLMNEATISTLSVFLSNVDSGTTVSKRNLVELYNGSHSGFSIRSLESKIFKWQAPTIFLVAGKRLRPKTAASNKRYLQFDSEYPRFFRSNESSRQSWQKETDRIVYAVYVSQPWKNSNKNNFGDESTAIVSLSPRYDEFKSKLGTVSAGKSIYFNNQGMGIGFGNEQPINKNTTRKYIPGNVSLTIEANLEFAVFRHIYNASANTPHHFKTSENSETSHQDYEDRFVITDLEVWGVGSTKELDEQRKQWEWEEKMAQARQSVNLRNLDEDRAFLEMVGLVGNHGGGSV